jgi:lambda repressor-like predicted transcriptional regulator
MTTATIKMMKMTTIMMMKMKTTMVMTMTKPAMNNETHPSTITRANCDLDRCILALGIQVAEVWSNRYRLLEMPSVVTEPR